MSKATTDMKGNRQEMINRKYRCWLSSSDKRVKITGEEDSSGKEMVAIPNEDDPKLELHLSVRVSCFPCVHQICFKNSTLIQNTQS